MSPFHRTHRNSFPEHPPATVIEVTLSTHDTAGRLRGGVAIQGSRMATSGMAESGTHQAGYLSFGAAPEVLVFDRAAISHGELWRHVTGHWEHSDLEHAIWDITALLLLGVLFEACLQWRLPLALLVGTVGVDVWLWWGGPALQYYCWLSGILNSLLVMGLIRLWIDLRHPLVLLTGVAAAMKICVEINAGQALLTQTVWPSVPSVHAVGFLCGLVLG